MVASRRSRGREKDEKASGKERGSGLRRVVGRKERGKERKRKN